MANNMNGNSNLIPMKDLSPEDVRQMRSNGGKKSGVIRRHKKTLKEVAEAILDMRVTDAEREKLVELGMNPEVVYSDVKNKKSLGYLACLHSATVKGSAYDYKLLMELAGEYIPQDRTMIVPSETSRPVINVIMSGQQPHTNIEEIKDDETAEYTEVQSGTPRRVVCPPPPGS